VEHRSNRLPTEAEIAAINARHLIDAVLHRHWPEVEKMLVMVDSFETPRSLWHTDPEFRRRILHEWDKIEPYKAKGFSAEWP
jgi:hypothetical protein